MTTQDILLNVEVPLGTCDPVTLEIIRGAVVATQKEMEALIERTAISAFIREKKDFYTALFDEKGIMAVGSMVPIFGDLTAPVIREYPRETMRPGDLFWYNDCYGSDGAVTHSNDQVLLAPVFVGNRLCGFVMCWAHFADIGGIYPGSISPEATSIYQEGIIIPPLKLIDGGVVNEMALKIFHRNSRFPAQSEGDLSALMAAVKLGCQRVAEVVELQGADIVQDALAQLLERNRTMVRRRLAETFDYGTYKFADYIDTDGHGNGPFKIAFALTREKGANGEDRFIFDASESDDQAYGPVNLLMNKGVPGMALGLYYLGGDPGLVCNAGGALSLDEVIYRPGSIVQPQFPAPLGMRGLTMMRTLAVLNGLVNAAGGGAPASHPAYVVNIMRGTFTNEAGQSEPFLLADGIGVGYGARANTDGIDAVYFVAQENYPVEFLEMGYPVRLLRYGVRPDSGGAGEFRGGVGIVREYEILADEAQLAIRIDGVQNPAWGINGGMGGGVGGAVVNPGQPNERRLPPLSEGTKLSYGDILRIETGGGGGYGHPYDRPAETVLEDVLGGFVTAAAAQSLYGVVITEDQLDVEATQSLRANRPAVRAFHRKDYVDELV